LRQQPARMAASTLYAVGKIRTNLLGFGVWVLGFGFWVLVLGFGV